MSYEYRGMTIPSEQLQSLENYRDNKWLPGGFLTAVLSNNLMEACGRADDNNLRLLPAWVAYLYNEMPARCHGSPELVKAWIEGK